MVFGNLAVSSSVGTVVLTPEGSRSATGGVALPATAGTFAGASFIVTGTADYTIYITLPAGATIIDDNAGHTMTADNWVCTPTPSGTLTDGSITLKIGATLNVGANQVAGVYTSDTPFHVTVNYN